MSLPAVAVSAPGKVLFAGGFLVLDRQHTGLVFGLDARIHVFACGLPKSVSSGVNSSQIVVKSPQFQDATWLYEISSTGEQESHGPVKVEQVRGEETREATSSLNKFVETTLRYVLTYLLHVVGVSIFDSMVEVTILADQDYYSQPTKPFAQEDTSRWKTFDVKLSDAHKTGLGSSAALVTSLVSALLACYLKKSSFDKDTPLNQQTIHNLAQAAHCAAQGKVGSGFDVAAAVYGSCLYRRFTPTILENVGEPTSSGFSERLHRCIDDLELNSKWDVEVASQAVEIPDSLLLVMCDVDCGSETPGMVRKVLQWRKENVQEATMLWSALQQGQEELCRELRRLAEAHDVEHDFTALGDIVSTVRSLMREMSVKSDVPIEPPVITELLDFCTSIPGVVGGVAPGAGGYDAVALLLKNDSDISKTLQASLKRWKSQDDTGAKIGKVRLLGVKQENEGIRMENVSHYHGWIRPA